MKLRLCVTGKLKESPELEMVKKYLSRFEKIGRSINLFPIEIIEYDSLKWTKYLLEKKSSNSSFRDSYKVLLDERGKQINSKLFAKFLIKNRDDGISEVVFFIGGADGVPDNLKLKFNQIISFGTMVWPHMMARIMLMEQIYRASTIIAAVPYHKE
jgi:23S rRNA (pseudouridine1915-N3)-methyltransferase